MDLVEGGEPPNLMPAEEEVDILVSVYAEELSDDLEGENLRVRKLWRRATLANAATLKQAVDETEDGDDEAAKIQEKTSVTFGAIWADTERREVFSGSSRILSPIRIARW